jgi:2-succinyl-6-hydroxy-2,4-cyclohexadiene-1-carboxylate synthase
MLFYKTHVGKSAPVLFFHGFMGSGLEGTPLRSKVLSWHFIDLPGHGKTKQTATVEDIETYLTNLQGPFHLVGYSLGGRVAQKLASHPQCLSLSLLSSYTLFDKEAYTERRAFEQKLKKDIEELPIETFISNFYNSPLFTSLKHKPKLFEPLLKRRSSLTKKDLLFALEQLTVAKIHSDLPSCPTLGLYGEYDAKYQTIYTKLPPTVTVVSIDNAGHAIHLENPKACLKHLEHFIQAVEYDNMDSLRTISGHRIS